MSIANRVAARYAASRKAGVVSTEGTGLALRSIEQFLQEVKEYDLAYPRKLLLSVGFLHEGLEKNSFPFVDYYSLQEEIAEFLAGLSSGHTLTSVCLRGLSAKLCVIEVGSPLKLVSVAGD